LDLSRVTAKLTQHAKSPDVPTADASASGVIASANAIHH
jgi:hypothetical protein